MAPCRYPPGCRNCLCHGYGLRAGAQGSPGQDGRGLRSSRGISSLFTARPPWRRWPCPRERQGLALAQGRCQGASSAQLYLALVHPAIGLGSLCKVDTSAYPAGSGKGANKGRVTDEAAVQGMEQMPIPGCITGVACCAQCVGKPSYRTVTLSPAWLVAYEIYGMPVCRGKTLSHCFNRRTSRAGRSLRAN